MAKFEGASVKPVPKGAAQPTEEILQEREVPSREDPLIQGTVGWSNSSQFDFSDPEMENPYGQSALEKHYEARDTPGSEYRTGESILEEDPLVQGMATEEPAVDWDRQWRRVYGWVPSGPVLFGHGYGDEDWTDTVQTSTGREVYDPEVHHEGHPDWDYINGAAARLRSLYLAYDKNVVPPRTESEIKRLEHLPSDPNTSERVKAEMFPSERGVERRLFTTASLPEQVKVRGGYEVYDPKIHHEGHPDWELMSWAVAPVGSARREYMAEQPPEPRYSRETHPGEEF